MQTHGRAPWDIPPLSEKYIQVLLAQHRTGKIDLDPFLNVELADRKTGSNAVSTADVTPARLDLPVHAEPSCSFSGSRRCGKESWEMDPTKSDGPPCQHLRIAETSMHSQSGDRAPWYIPPLSEKYIQALLAQHRTGSVDLDPFLNVALADRKNGSNSVPTSDVTSARLDLPVKLDVSSSAPSYHADQHPREELQPRHSHELSRHDSPPFRSVRASSLTLRNPPERSSGSSRVSAVPRRSISFSEPISQIDGHPFRSVLRHKQDRRNLLMSEDSYSTPRHPSHLSSAHSPLPVDHRTFSLEAPEDSLLPISKSYASIAHKQLNPNHALYPKHDHRSSMSESTCSFEDSTDSESTSSSSCETSSASEPTSPPPRRRLPMRAAADRPRRPSTLKPPTLPRTPSLTGPSTRVARSGSSGRAIDHAPPTSTTVNSPDGARKPSSSSALIVMPDSVRLPVRGTGRLHSNSISQPDFDLRERRHNTSPPDTGTSKVSQQTPSVSKNTSAIDASASADPARRARAHSYICGEPGFDPFKHMPPVEGFDPASDAFKLNHPMYWEFPITYGGIMFSVPPEKRLLEEVEEQNT